MTGTGKTLNATIEDAYNFHVGLAEESDRGAAVLAVSRFEDVLRQAISIRLIDLDKKTQKVIFEGSGPLSGFFRRMFVALGFFDRKTLNGLKTINSIRNKFAHSAEPMGFDHEAIKSAVVNLETSENTDDSRKKYLTFLREAESCVRLKMHRV